ncbi:acyl-CoA dehydrogenase family protein [Glaciihabitans sp. UYNi722]|uniref:acyl-CoA dehydrogenase family protein n=1 Tax=Glaciihabitans sp. UYNi722 TaxID=3156344 RepID=UPI003399D102
MSRGTLSVPKVVTDAQGLYELLATHGDQHDREGRLADPVVDALHDIGAFGAFVPRDLGGSELTPREAMDLFSTLAYADAAAGWVSFAIGFGTGLPGAFLDRDTADELFATPRLAVAGQGTRPGKAAPTKGGYLLSGAWSFASGIKHSTHLLTTALDTETGEVRGFVLPVDQVTFDDNWDVMGLRGTGSIDYTLSDIFVPSNYSFSVASTTPITGGHLYRIGVGNFATINHGGWVLGVGRRLLDELAASIRAKAGQPGSLASNDAFIEDFGNAEVKLRAAKAFLYESWGEIEEVLESGDPIPVRLETLTRAALNNATWRTQEIATFVYASSGTTALRRGTIQRFFRDTHGGTQHISSSRLIMQSAGQELAGLAEGKRWVHHSLK